MKIGVLTHWWCNENYGQQLQGFALQSYLRSKGHEVILIRYRPVSSIRKKIIKVICNPTLIFKVLRIPDKRKLDETKLRFTNRDFECFRRQYINVTDEIFYSYNELSAADLNADAYICGSDQVWNEFFVKKDINGKPWFLGFGRPEVKRIAYAASFGATRVSDEYLQFIRPLLHNFDGISVREKSGIEICCSAGRTDAAHVVDPTLLLEAEQYLSLIPKKTKNDALKPLSSHALFYFLKAEMDVPWDELVDYCDKKGYHKKSTTVYGRIDVLANYTYDPSISEWIESVKSAKIIFTNSFHGTVFSVLMNRPFISFLRKGETRAMNTRIESLLSTLGLEERIYDYNQGSVAEQVAKEIDWQSVNERLKKMREYSIRFLEANGL